MRQIRRDCARRYSGVRPLSHVAWIRDVQLQYLTLSQFPPSDAESAENKFAQTQAQATQAETESPVRNKATQQRKAAAR